MSLMRAIFDKIRKPVVLVDAAPPVASPGLLGGPGLEMPETTYTLDGNRASRRRMLYPSRCGAYTRRK